MCLHWLLFFPLPPLPRSVRRDPSELVSPFPSSLPPICHTVCLFFFSSLPHPQWVHGLSSPRAELRYSCTPPLQLRIIIWFHTPSPSVLKFSPSSSSSSLFLPQSVVAAASPPRPSVCIFGFRRLQRGGGGLRRRDGDKVGDGSDGKMALVERRGRTSLDLKLH